MSKQNLVIFIDWFVPAYKAGGPVQSIHRLSSELSSEFTIYIITGNTDVDGSVLDVKANTWVKHEDGCNVIYLSYEQQNILRFKALIEEVSANCFYVNGIFSAKFSIAALRLLRAHNLLSSTVLAPRGMLGAGALKIKALKKAIFLKVFQMLGIPNTVTWHSTAIEESVDIRRAFGSQVKIVEVPNFPRLLQPKQKQFTSNGLRLFFYSRISEKKNLLGALTALKSVQGKGVVFSIYGPIEDQAYWKQCQQKIAELPQHIQVQYKGLVEPNKLTSVLADEEVLLLPTLNENYGHAIVESLYCGCAVIISDQTPWSDVSNSAAGLVTAVNDYDGIAKAIDKFAAMTVGEKELFSNNAIAYIRAKVNTTEIKNRYISLFNGALKN